MLLFAQDPIIEMIAYLLKILNVKVTKTSITKTLENHPEYPSLLSINDALKNWNIETISLTVAPETLTELPTPFIAHCHTKEGDRFLLISQTNKKTIKFIDAGKNRILDKVEFLKIWSGVVLLVEINELSGDKNFKANRLNEKLKNLRLPLILTISACVTIVDLFSFYRNNIKHYSAFVIIVLLKLLGIGVTSLLLWYEVDKYNPTLKKICSAGNKVNCNAVLNSSVSRIFNWLSLSEVGFFYFSSTFITLSLFKINSISDTFSSILILNLVALPATIFSFYYQWRIVKQWCLLCLCVQGLLILEFVTIFLFGLLETISLPHIPGILEFILIVIVVAVSWYSVKPLILNTIKLKQSKLELIHLKGNSEIFMNLLYKQKALNISTNNLGINIGSATPATSIIKVCNPYCVPCAYAHDDLEKILIQKNDVGVKIIFRVNNIDLNSSALPVKHLLAIYEKGNEQLTRLALYDWYSAKEKNYQAFAMKYPIMEDLNEQNYKVEAMLQWCNEVDITFTPTIFINGYQMPDAYNLSDLSYFF